MHSRTRAAECDRGCKLCKADLLSDAREVPRCGPSAFGPRRSRAPLRSGPLAAARRQERAGPRAASSATSEAATTESSAEVHRAQKVARCVFTVEAFTAELRLETRVLARTLSLSGHSLQLDTDTPQHDTRDPGARTAPEMPRTRDLRDAAMLARPVDSLGMLSCHLEMHLID